MTVQLLKTVLGSCAMVGLGLSAALAQDACSLDGKPLSGEVRYYSTGGTYGEALEVAYFKPFEEKCGVKVIPVSSKRTFEQLVQMHEAGHYQYDMGSSLGFEFPLGIEKGIYAKLPENFWDDIKEGMIPAGMSDYGAWNSTFSQVLAYSTKALPAEFGKNGWADFWDVKTYPGKRSLNDDPRALIFALLADGVEPKDIYPLDYDRAFAKLDEIKPEILFWWKAGDQPVQGILNGEIVAAAAFNGRVSSRVLEGEPITSTWNGHLFQVGWNVVIKGAPNERNAVALLHFMQNAKGQAKQAEMTQYLGANKDALKLLPPAVAETLASAHLEGSYVPYDQDWWTANIEDANKRWNKWRAQ